MLFHFKADTNVTRVKSSGNHQFYSDAETEDTPSNQPVVLIGKSNSISIGSLKND